MLSMEKTLRMLLIEEGNFLLTLNLQVWNEVFYQLKQHRKAPRRIKRLRFRKRKGEVSCRRLERYLVALVREGALKRAYRGSRYHEIHSPYRTQWEEELRVLRQRDYNFVQRAIPLVEHTRNRRRA